MQMTTKNPGDDRKLHVLVTPMVCVLPYAFHGGLSQAAEKPLPAVGKSYKFRQGRHVKSSSPLEPPTQKGRRLMKGNSGHHRDIPPLEG